MNSLVNSLVYVDWKLGTAFAPAESESKKLINNLAEGFLFLSSLFGVLEAIEPKGIHKLSPDGETSLLEHYGRLGGAIAENGLFLLSSLEKALEKEKTLPASAS